MISTVNQSRIPEALPVEFDPPRLVPMPTRLPEPPPEGGNQLRPLQYLKYRWATVLFLGGFLATIFAGVAYSVIPAKYTTYSIIRVSPQDPRIFYNEDPNGRSDFSSYLKTQAGMLRSQFVLNAALRDPEIAALPMLKEQPDPVRYLEEELLIETQDGSELIKPKLNGDDPRAIAMIVNAIHRAYFKEIVEEERRRKQRRLKEIEDSISSMQTDLEKKFPPQPKDLPGDKPAESLPGVGPTLAANQVARLREKLDNVEIRQRQLEEEKKRLVRRLEKPHDEVPSPPQSFFTQLEGDPAITGINRQMAQWQKQLTFQLELNNDPNRVGIRDLKQKMAEGVTERERIRKERLDDYRKGQLEETVRRLKLEGEKIDIELENLKIVQARTTAEIREYEGKLAKILPASPEQKKDFSKVDTENRTEIISNMMEKANLLRLELKAPTRVQSFQEAAVPMKRDMKKQLLGTGAAFAFGFLLVGLGVVGFEARVRRVMTLADVRQAANGAVMGTIPSINNLNGQPTFELALAEEGIEKTRATLSQHFGRAGGKFILLTSALGDEGRTFLTRELALSCARAGGRTLLVDFDLRQPYFHEEFGLPNESGFSELLQGTTDPESAIRLLPYGLAFLSAGQWSDGVRQNLSAERLGEVFALLRSQFDYVIASGHPVLSVAETALASRSADAVILTAERYESRLPLVTRAQEKIQALSPEIFGVVYLGATREECLQ